MNSTHNIKTPIEKVGAIEHQLAGSLKQVSPSRAFVSQLGNRIHSVRPPAIVNRVENIHWIALVVAGSITLGVLAALGVRALADFLGKKPLRRA